MTLMAGYFPIVCVMTVEFQQSHSSIINIRIITTSSLI